MPGTIDDCYAPNLLSHFHPNGEVHSGVNIAVECGICSMELAITQPADSQHETFTSE
ncbi:hypothetical protein F4803DRAFT_546353 [Xylaria telfairii]|nr:hypothetical protein F4803DRAFT_546353 [Xylaria telfairii]